MKICIMTMQRIINYGSFLQAYGLKKTIEGLGHDVSFVDFHIEPCRTAPKAKRMIFKLILSCIKKAILFVYSIVFYRRHKRRIAERSNAYDEFADVIKKANEEFLGIPAEPCYLTEADVLIIGSDEVFNCLNSDTLVGYSLELFGQNHRAKKLISYAASFGNTTYDKLCLYGVDSEISNLLKNFDFISVRDKNSGDIINKLINQQPYYHLDPVLIYRFHEEVRLQTTVPHEDYIILYAYPYRISKTEAAEITAFARKHGKKVVSIAGYQSFCDENIVCSPLEVLNYFNHADFVVTDTFHGCVLSIKFNKCFAAFVRSSENNSYGNSEKLGDLLNRFSLQSRIVRHPSLLDEILSKEIDYSEPNSIVENEKQKSLEYLQNAINKTSNVIN